jgi:hypothetical protein
VADKSPASDIKVCVTALPNSYSKIYYNAETLSSPKYEYLLAKSFN